MGRRQCQHEGCCKQAQASLEGVSKYCFTHMTYYGMNPKTHICEHIGCCKQVATSSCGVRKYCRGHMKEYGLQPREHQCQHDGCEKRVQTSEEGSRLYCIQHMRHYGLNPRQHTCKHPGCLSRACYSTDGQRLYCGTHMRQNGLKPQRRLCIQDGCVKQAQCSKTGEYNYCYAHMKLYGLKPYRGKGQMQRPSKKQKLAPPAQVQHPPASTLSDSSENTDLLHRTSPATSHQTQSPVVSSLAPLGQSTRMPDNRPGSLNVPVIATPELLSPEGESRARALRHAVAASGRYEHTSVMLPPLSSTLNRPRSTDYRADSYPSDPTAGVAGYPDNMRTSRREHQYDYCYQAGYSTPACEEQFEFSRRMMHAEPASGHTEMSVSRHVEPPVVQRKLVMLPSDRNPPPQVKPELQDFSAGDFHNGCHPGRVSTGSAPSSQDECVPSVDWLDDWPVLGAAAVPPAPPSLPHASSISSTPKTGSHSPDFGGITSTHQQPAATSSGSSGQVNTPSQDLSCTPLKDSSLTQLFDLGASSATAPHKLSQIANSIFGTPGRASATPISFGTPHRSSTSPISSSSPLDNADWLLGSPMLADHLLDSAILSFTPPPVKTSPTSAAKLRAPIPFQLESEVNATSHGKHEPLSNNTFNDTIPVLDKAFNLDADLDLLESDLNPKCSSVDTTDHIVLDELMSTGHEGTAPGTCPQPSGHFQTQQGGQQWPMSTSAPHAHVSEPYANMDWPHHAQNVPPMYPPSAKIKVEDPMSSHSPVLEQPHSYPNAGQWPQADVKAPVNGCVNFDTQAFFDDWTRMDDIPSISHGCQRSAARGVPGDSLSQTRSSMPGGVHIKSEAGSAPMQAYPSADGFPHSQRGAGHEMTGMRRVSSADAWQGVKSEYHREPSALDLQAMSTGGEQRRAMHTQYTNSTDYTRGTSHGVQHRPTPHLQYTSSREYPDVMGSMVEHKPAPYTQYTNTRDYPQSMQPAATQNRVSGSRAHPQHSVRVPPPLAKENYGVKHATYTSSALAPVSQTYSAKYQAEVKQERGASRGAADAKWAPVTSSSRARSMMSLEEQTAALRDACALREATMNVGTGRNASDSAWAMAGYM